MESNVTNETLENFVHPVNRNNLITQTETNNIILTTQTDIDPIESKLNIIRSKFFKNENKEISNNSKKEENNNFDKIQILFKNPKFSEMIKIIEPELQIKNKKSIDLIENKNNLYNKINLNTEPNSDYNSGATSPNNRIKDLTQELNELIYSDPSLVRKQTNSNQTRNIINNINIYEIKYNMADYLKKENNKNLLNENKNLQNENCASNNENKIKYNFANYDKINKTKNSSLMKYIFSPLMREEINKEFYQNKKSQILNLMNKVNSDDNNNLSYIRKIKNNKTNNNLCTNNDNNFWDVTQLKVNNFFHNNKIEDRIRQISDNIYYKEKLEDFSNKLFGKEDSFLLNRVKEYPNNNSRGKS